MVDALVGIGDIVGVEWKKPTPKSDWKSTYRFESCPRYYNKNKTMTKVIILGEQAEQKTELKKIEFVKMLSVNVSIEKSESKPSSWQNIELICKNYGDYDLMYAYDNDRNDGVLYLGHFNDGVV